MSKEENFSTLIYEESPYTYIGKTARGNTDEGAALWQIQRVDETTTAPTKVLWADGFDSFDKILDDRAGYTYK